MDIFIILLFTLIFWRLKPVALNSEYLGRDTTTAIKGIFAVFIIFNHSRQYLLPLPTDGYAVNLGLIGGVIYNAALDFLGQLIVVMFFVYSGYGIMEAFKRKRGDYLNGFLRKRVIKTLVHFDIAVLLFIILAFILGHEYSLYDYMFCLTGWSAVGNSNWFIFDIIILYLLSYLGLAITIYKGFSEKTFLWIISIASLCFSFFMFIAKSGQSWWYDTILAFPLGVLWSIYHTEFEARLKDDRKYFIALCLLIIAFVMFYWTGRYYKAFFSLIASPLFGLLVILLTMKIRVGNPVLHWLGVNAFAIYMLQRLPMIVTTEYGLNEVPLVFMIIVIPSTLLIAWLFTTLTGKIDSRLFS